MASRLSDWRPPEIRLRRRHFYGDDSEEFLEWSQHMAYYFRQRDYDQDEQCDVAINCLGGYAWDWWCRVEDERWDRAWQPVETWEQLVYLMTRHFAPGVDPIAYAARSKQRTMPYLERISARTLVRPSEDLPERTPARVTVLLPPTLAPPVALVPATTPPAPTASAPAPDPEITPTPTDVPLLVPVLTTCEYVVPSEPTSARPPPLVISAPTSMVPMALDVPSFVPVTTTCESFILAPSLDIMHQSFRYISSFICVHRLLTLAPTSSKRGRFDSKGGRMMRYWPAIRWFTKGLSQPRPWRPPWSST